MDDLLNYRDQQGIVLKRLAALGLEKRIIKSIGGIIPRETNLYHNCLGGLPLRKGELWLQNRYNGILVDRFIRFYEHHYGDITTDKQVTPEQLADVTYNYLHTYQHDNMNANRIYYLISAIKSGSGVVNVDTTGCSSCKKTYFIHPRLTRTCSACELYKEAEKDKSIYDEIHRTIYKDEPNLANVKPREFKLKSSVLRILQMNEQPEQSNENESFANHAKRA